MHEKININIRKKKKSKVTGKNHRIIHSRQSSSSSYDSENYDLKVDNIDRKKESEESEEREERRKRHFKETYGYLGFYEIPFLCDEKK